MIINQAAVVFERGMKPAQTFERVDAVFKALEGGDDIEFAAENRRLQRLARAWLDLQIPY